MTNTNKKISKESNDEDSCKKCGKKQDVVTLFMYDGMCPVCWTEGYKKVG